MRRERVEFTSENVEFNGLIGKWIILNENLGFNVNAND